jgi:scyllo-inositol 2-dehydrogenase (NADP+)
MRAIVVGLGVQGHKRRRFAGSDFVATVDTVNSDADFSSLGAVPKDCYDAALVCVPDDAKIEVVSHLLDAGKHVLVEKPMWGAGEEELRSIEALARQRGVVCYTAYNHRFEPHFVRMRDLIASGELGKIYRCRMFYGNGTARLVRDSDWRDQGAGVLPDLGSHLLDTIDFWFGRPEADFSVYASHCFENRAPDHVVIGCESASPTIELEMTLLQWRNHFVCDVFAEHGTAHISSLCKWGPSTFTHRRRILPSGRPPEKTITLVEDDPTWAAEYSHFKRLCADGQGADLSQDIWLYRSLQALAAKSLEFVAQ